MSPDGVPATVRAVTVGEALVDVLGRDRVPGGSPLNVAVGLSRLGVPTTLLTQLGDDADGRSIRAHVEASGVTLDAAPAARTSAAVATIAADGGATYDFDVTWSLPARELPVGGLFHCGSIAAYLEPGAATVLDLLDRAVADGAVTSFDPNVRPAFLPDRDAAWAQTRRIAEGCALVKLSDEDATWLAPAAGVRDDQAVDGVAAALLAGERTRVVIVTEGARGAAAFHAGGTERLASAASSTVADTVGAGDSFMAALLAVVAARLAADVGDPLAPRGLAALLASADAAARVTVSRPGADPPWRHELASDWGV